jgi:hypothetical protein
VSDIDTAAGAETDEGSANNLTAYITAGAIGACLIGACILAVLVMVLFRPKNRDQVKTDGAEHLPDLRPQDTELEEATRTRGIDLEWEQLDTPDGFLADLDKKSPNSKLQDPQWSASSDAYEAQGEGSLAGSEKRKAGRRVQPKWLHSIAGTEKDAPNGGLAWDDTEMHEWGDVDICAGSPADSDGVYAPEEGDDESVAESMRCKIRLRRFSTNAGRNLGQRVLSPDEYTDPRFAAAKNDLADDDTYMYVDTAAARVRKGQTAVGTDVDVVHFSYREADDGLEYLQAMGAGEETPDVSGHAGRALPEDAADLIASMVGDEEADDVVRAMASVGLSGEVFQSRATAPRPFESPTAPLEVSSFFGGSRRMSSSMWSDDGVSVVVSQGLGGRPILSPLDHRTTSTGELPAMDNEWPDSAAHMRQGAGGIRAYVQDQLPGMLGPNSPVSPMLWESALSDYSNSVASAFGEDKSTTANPLFNDSFSSELSGQDEDHLKSVFGDDKPAQANPLYDGDDINSPLY